SVQVVDNQAPIITLLGDSNITHEAGTAYIDSGANWNDSVDGNGTADANGTVDENVPGIYTIIYSFTDSSGNTAVDVNRTIEVVDTTPPVITLTGDANVSIEAGLSFTDPGATWQDAVDGNGTAQISGTLNENIPGTYVLSYDHTDTNGNAGHTITREIFVSNEPPTKISPSFALQFKENLDVGTWITSFVGYDPNVVQHLTYSLEDGNNSWDNHLFSMDDNGSLFTKSSFDYESDPLEYIIRVRVKDEHNASFDKLFTLELLDVYENRPPMEITIDSSTINENNLPGSVVGIFKGFDPDENDTLHYSIVPHVSYFMDDNLTEDSNHSFGSYEESFTESNDTIHNNESNFSLAHESLFQLDVNGSLRAIRALDYEQDQINTNLLVRAEDQDGAFFEQLFSIEILNVIEDMDKDGIEDAYDEDRDGDGFDNTLEIESGTDPDDQYSTIHKPILETFDGGFDENGTFILSGMVNFSGNGKIEDFGFILSSSISMNGEQVDWIRGKGTPNAFALRFANSPYSPTLYFRSWAKNAAGYGIGPVKKLTIPEPEKTWWGETVSMPGGWKESTWFGMFIYYEQGWLYHAQLGWLYSAPDENDGVWLWSKTQGWLWTGEELWPYLYKNDSADWLYFTTTKNNQPIFYDYSTSSYIGLESIPTAESVSNSIE
ncbi:MAG: DUF5011 domain-containing protein, partial [Opitutales bacterium]|nr:DUF5011 domain-containing protein [Opitutales bacterium]